jgi:hypothetical protein
MVPTIPHRVAEGMCPVSGIRDLVQWRTGRDWSNEFVHGLGLGGGFAYLRIKVADPPRQVYWGVASPRQHSYLAGLFGARYLEIEGRSFDFAWGKAQDAVDAGTPPVLGPLDMFHLHYYEDLYQQRHIPIHYVLLVGSDDENALILDTGLEETQTIPLDELRSAWNVSVPGLGKRNRLVVLDLPPELPPTDVLIRASVAAQCDTMLRPPVSMLGIPAMRKLSREIAGWPKELGAETTDRCVRQVREYLNSPPDLEGDHVTAGRDRYVAFLEEAGPMAGLDFSEPLGRLRESLATIPQVHAAICRGDLIEAAACFDRIATAEEAAFSELERMVAC